MVARAQQPARTLFEAHGSVERLDLVATPGVSVQVMHEVAAPRDEHSLVTQWREPLRQLVVVLRGLRLVGAELYEGHPDTRLGRAGDMARRGKGKGKCIASLGPGRQTV